MVWYFLILKIFIYIFIYFPLFEWNEAWYMIDVISTIFNRVENDRIGFFFLPFFFWYNILLYERWWERWWNFGSNKSKWHCKQEMFQGSSNQHRHAFSFSPSSIILHILIFNLYYNKTHVYVYRTSKKIKEKKNHV